MKQSDFVRKTPIQKGWSCDKKYCVTTADGTNYLLRITPHEKSASRESLFRMMQQAAALGVPMCLPVESGSCEEGVYSLQSWIDGEDAEERIPLQSDTEQYVYGREAGRILKMIHSIPAPAHHEDWEIRFNRKLDRKIQMYTDCPLHYENGQSFLDYINANRNLLKNRPQCFQHGDYHLGNMMIDREGKLKIIDFDRYDFGDPWEEFNRIVWCAQKSPFFASGLVSGYFDGEPPVEFWQLLALYIASNTLSSLPWAIPFGQTEIDTMQNQATEVLQWYDGMKRVVPSWYCGNVHLQTLDGVPFRLKAPFDFGFLCKYGRVFKVFDDQDSGNICFGCEKGGKRCFVKFAGAPTARGAGTPEEAIARLKAAEPLYRALRHPNLIRLICAEEIGGGFALVFDWSDGICMGRMYPESHRRFLQLNLEAKRLVFRDLLHFFEHTAAQGYVAIDFYDGSILFDFDRRKTTVCDIDSFRKAPAHNDMGRMWGSSRFMSPEEFVLGAALDEITNVYTLGATAFALFSDCSRSREAWPLGDEAFAVVTRAVSPNRSDRQQSIRELTEQWEDAMQNPASKMFGMSYESEGDKC